MRLMCAHTVFFSTTQKKVPEVCVSAVCENDSYSWRKVDFFTKWHKICSHKVGGGKLELEIDQISGVCLKTHYFLRKLKNAVLD